MSTLFYVLLILAPAAILATAYAIIKKRNQGRSIKRSVAVNLATFAVLTVLIAALSVSVFAADDNTASAADASAATTATETVDNSKGMGLLAAGLVTGLAGIGGGIAVAVAATAEDPKSFGKSIIFVALGESIALYGVVISILILQKV
jgi:V/A-type H+-transporting ATPase subunit K